MIEQQQQLLTESDSQILLGDPTYNHNAQRSELLFNLPVKDRIAIEEEVHGVSCMAREETPELLEESLHDFHLKLTEIECKAYDRAQEIRAENHSEQRSSYILGRGLKLSFLRCELFDIDKAATRYCKYLDLILELYGEIALRRPLRMSDLGRKEISYLREGQYQIMPYRDRSGRRIMSIVANKPQFIEKMVLAKILIYIWIGTIGDNDFDHLETQHAGAIVILKPTYQTQNEERQGSLLQKVKARVEANALVASVIPVRVAAMHICLPNSPLATILASLFSMHLGMWLPRVKFHFGNPLEQRYQLQGYGIPTELIPVTETGTVKSVHLKQWIKLRGYLEQKARKQEVMLQSSESDSAGDSAVIPPMADIVECPGSKDVIFRRGKSMSYHYGNVKFQNLIESKIYEHTIDPETTLQRRVAIEKELIQQIRDDGGRFLKWETGECWWTNMSIDNGNDSDNGNGNSKTLTTSQEIDKKIQTKIHYAFRDYRKKMLKTQAPIVEVSSTYAFERLDGQKRLRYSNGANDTSNDSTIGNGCLSVFYNLNGDLETFNDA